MKTCHAVPAHQPNETRFLKMTAKGLQRIKCVLRAQCRLGSADTNSRVPGNKASTRQSLGKGRHAGLRLQRVLWRHQPPHRIKAKPAHRNQADMDMGRVRRIERSAKQADPASLGGKHLDPSGRGVRGVSVHRPARHI